jgi:superfamily II DNA or RNA helicase
VGSFGDLLERLSPDPHLRGRQFERLCAWFLRNDSLYAAQLLEVWAWDEWPGRWGPDAGIDLVAETLAGDCWAVQCKAYAPSYAIRKADIDSFVAESARPQFVYRLLIATTNQIGPTAKRTVDDLGIGLELATDLAKAPVAWPDSPDDLAPRRPDPKRPMPHQQIAIDDVSAGLAEHERGQLVMACGTGKTLVGLWVTERLGAQRVLVLLPSLSLLAQTMREWAANSTDPFLPLPVCSDDTVREQEEEDHLLEHTSELGLPATTDPAVIAAFLSRGGRRVVFATYQSSAQLVAACAAAPEVGFDLAIADEAHRCAGAGGSTFSTILDPDAIPVDRRLFMTATPRYLSDRVRARAAAEDYEVTSMDDPARFGPVLHRLSFAEAIAKDLLSDYDVAIVGVDNPTVRETIERAALVAGSDARPTDARNLAAQIGVAKAIAAHDLHRVVTFHGRVAAARRFSTALPETIAWMPEEARPPGRMWSAYVSGEMPSGRRDTLLGRLRNLGPGERGVLANARCLAEGVDVPAIDGVAFIDPRRSQVDVVQAVGRAIRRAPDKAHGTVILPVFVDTTRPPEEAVQESAFEPVWSVLRALRSHDAELGEVLDALRRQLGRRDGGPLRLPGKIRLDLPVRVGAEFADAIVVRLVEATTPTWEQWFAMLGDYVDEHGDALVPIGYAVGGSRLGRWVGTQRDLYRRGELPADRASRLDTIPTWTWSPQAEEWPQSYAALQAFVAREGHAEVPKRHVEAGVSLGTWVQHQRTDYRTGMIGPDRAAALEAVPSWVWNTKHVRWDQGFAALQRFSAREGHPRVPDLHYEDGFPLGHWVRHQRQLHTRCELSRAREVRLVSIDGWAWDIDADSWERTYRLVKAFAAREGHARVPTATVVDGVRIGAWVANQRTAYMKGHFPDEKAARLEALPGWAWNAFDATWNANYEAVTTYLSRTGPTEVPKGTIEDGNRIGWWIGTQRQAYKQGLLSAERAERLEALPGWTWDTIDTAWDNALRHLRDYVGLEGDAGVPVKYICADGYPLGTWASTQRRRRKTGKLAAERITQLEAFQGWRW